METGLFPLHGMDGETSDKAIPPVEAWDPRSCGDIGLEIKRDGTWLHAGDVIARPALVKLFARHLRCDRDGTHWVVTPVEKAPVAVEIAPFTGVRLDVDTRADGRQILTILTNVGDRVTVGPDHGLRVTTSAHSDPFPLLRVRGRLDALLTRAVYYELAERAQRHPETGRLGVRSGETFFALDGGDAVATADT